MGTNVIDAQYHLAATIPDTIHEHIELLYDYARQSEHVTECGVESVVSTWAFLRGLRDNTREKKRLLSIDLVQHANVRNAREAARDARIDFEFRQGSDLCVVVEPTDLCFIDTWHVYGHLKRELARFAPLTRRWIILHDTTVDAEQGETIRRGWNAEEQALDSGYPIGEITRGVWPAVEEFLEANGADWRLALRRANCNGLTILERK